MGDAKMTTKTKTIDATCPAHHTTHTMVWASVPESGRIVWECPSCGGRWTANELEAEARRMSTHLGAVPRMRGEVA